MRHRLRTTLLIALALGLTVPSSAAPKAHARHGFKKKGVSIAPPVESVFHVNEAPLSPKTRIFLVAGSSLASSFAREIVEQKRLWLKAGFHEDEIACYYTLPFQEDFNEETAPFQSLAAELSKCYPANMRLLRQHLAKIGDSGEKPPFLYLYVTSHGEPPPATMLLEAKPTDTDYWQLRREAKYPSLDQFKIMLEGLPDGTAGQSELFGALRMGVPAEDLYLTPKHLRGLLDRAFANVPKFIVLQACYSGGFVEDPEPHRKTDLLSTLQNVTVLTAARFDRSSFGCEPGPYRTFFGGTFNDTLAKFLTSNDPRKVDWRALWVETVARISQLERQQKVYPPSLPQFFTSKPAR